MHISKSQGETGLRTYQTHQTKERLQLPLEAPLKRWPANTEILTAPQTCHLSSWCMCQGSWRQRTPVCLWGLQLCSASAVDSACLNCCAHGLLLPRLNLPPICPLTILPFHLCSWTPLKPRTGTPDPPTAARSLSASAGSSSSFIISAHRDDFAFLALSQLLLLRPLRNNDSLTLYSLSAAYVYAYV